MKYPELLAGQVALVTGAGRGIGRACALTLAQSGAAVVLVARSNDEITGVADEIKQQGGRALAIATDISDPAQVDHLLILILRAFNRVDILINNAALIEPIGKVWETAPAAWQKLVEVNLIGPYLTSRAVLPHLLERGYGRIINISSGLASINVQGTSAYSASKAALERFSGILAAEVTDRGVVVAVLRPGVVDTSMQSQLRQTPAHLLPQVGNWQVLYEQGQLRLPLEPAAAVLWLASPFAQDCNGQFFSLDDDAFRQRLVSDLGLPPLPPKERPPVSSG